jgi:hypothetical protein
LKLTFRLSEVSTRWGHENRFEIVIQVCQRHLHLHLRKELCILWVKKSWKVSSLLFCCQKKEVEKFATFYANTSSSSPCEKACFTSLVFLSFLFYFFIFSWRFFGRVNISQLWLFAADLFDFFVKDFKRTTETNGAEFIQFESKTYVRKIPSSF